MGQPSKKPRGLRRRKPGDLAQLRAVLWGVLLEVEAIAQDPNAERAEKLKAASALATLAGSYTRAIEAGDMEKRLQALEQVAGPILVDLTVTDPPSSPRNLDELVRGLSDDELEELARKLRLEPLN